MFYKILNKIKTHNCAGKKYLITSIKKNELNLIKTLVKLNIIKFIFKKNNKIVLVINFWKKNKIIFKFKNIYKPSNYKIIKFKNLKKINKKNKFLIMTSNNGIVNNFEAEKKKIGGSLIMYIWN